MFYLPARALSVLLVLSVMATTETQAAKLKKIRYVNSDGTVITAYLMRPRRRGRFPAIIALHGCSGLKRGDRRLLSRHRDWGKRFVRWGYVVLFPDSYGSRYVGSVCKRQFPPVSHNARIKDVMSARTWLRRQRFVRRNRISLLGWANGGTTVLKLAYSKRGAGFRQAFAFYPFCRPVLRRAERKQRTPTTILIGKKDDWTPPHPCQRLVWNRGGHIILYDRAYHGFDIPNARLTVRSWIPNTKRRDGLAHVGTNVKAREQAIRDVKRLLE